MVDQAAEIGDAVVEAERPAETTRSGEEQSAVGGVAP
jgi:hypothetical protein